MPMSNEAEAIFNAAMQLPADERQQLVTRIYQSLDTDIAPTPEQAAEIERRIDDVRQGRAQTIPGDEAYAEVMRRIQQGKRP
jgi:putative addiction module component (TIGR02574 family)